MIEQIKELRIRIDGLSQLVKGLYEPIKPLTINTIPNKDINELLQLMKSSGLTGIISADPITIKTTNGEISKCYDSLILAKAWLGKILGELGEQTPYQNDGKRKGVEDIESAADKDIVSNNNLGWLHLNHVEKVDWLRETIGECIKLIEKIGFTPTETFKPSRELNIARTNTYNHLCEARFWLGFELQRIKEKADGK